MYGDDQTAGGNGEANGRIGVGRAKASTIVAEEELLRLMLTGLTVKEASSHMRAHYTTVRKIARSPEFLLKVREHSAEIAQRMVDELSRSQIDFAQRLEQASETALEEMMQLMNESSGTLKFKIAQDLLDRDARSSKTKKLDLTGSMQHSFINPAMLIHAAAVAKEVEGTNKELPSGNGTGHPDDSK